MTHPTDPTDPTDPTNPTDRIAPAGAAPAVATPETVAPARPFALRAATLGVGLGLAGPAVARVHELLAGVAVGALTRGDDTAAAGRGRLASFAFAAAALLLVGLVAPLLLARAGGWSAVLVSLAIAAVPGLLAGRATRLDAGGTLAMTAGAALGVLLAGGALLPWAGPGACAITAAIAGVVAALVPDASVSSSSPSPRASAAALTLAGAGSSLLLLATGWLALGTFPWPSAAPPTLAAMALGGLAIGAALGRRGPFPLTGTIGLVLLLAAVLLALLLRGPGWGAVQAALDNQALPSVGPAGGALAIAIMGLVAGFVPALAAGLACGALIGREPTSPRGTTRSEPSHASTTHASTTHASTTPTSTTHASTALGSTALGSTVLGGAALGVVAAHALVAATAAAFAGLVGVALVAGAAAIDGPSAARGARRVVALAVAILAVALGAFAWQLDWSARAVPSAVDVVAREDAPVGTLIAGHEDSNAIVLGRGGVLSRTALDAVRSAPPADDVLAGHLAALLPAVPRRALVVGPHSREISRALATHGVETRRIDASRELARATRLAMGDAVGSEPSVGLAPTPGALARLVGGDGRHDAIVVTIDDPTWPGTAAWFSRDGLRHLRELIAPGGVLVRRLSTDRLGPEGLARVVLAQAEIFPATHVVTADQGRDGTVLAVSLVPAAGEDAAEAGDVAARLPWRRLLIDSALNPAMTAPVREDLARALLVQSDDLLASFAADVDEIRAAHDLQPIDAWSPGDAAWRMPAPELAARELARGMLYARIRTLDLSFALDARDITREGSEDTWRRWAFLGLDERLAPRWSSPGGTLRQANRFTEFRGVRGVYREPSWRQRFERDGATLTIRAVPRSRSTANTLISSIRSLRADDSAVRRRGRAALGGQPALWEFEEPSPGEHRIRLTWHCPSQARLYAAELERDDGMPGRHDASLEDLLRDLRCAPPAGR